MSNNTKNKPKLLLHICCAGCGSYVSQVLKDEFEIVLYFCNPNIFPEDEFNRRLEDVKKIAKKFALDLMVEDYDHKIWLNKVISFKESPEKGERCLICYADRLNSTARSAKKEHFDYFGTTLTVSPHKVAKAINETGEEFAKIYGINFLNRDFKKQEGFKKSLALSKELGLYRQDHCGCEFSRK